MIQDASTRIDIEREWASVKKLTASSHRQAQIPGGPFINETPPESFLNLPFVLAYAVLDEVLTELMSQGLFACKGRRPLLGAKMEASRLHLPWQDYALVDAGKNKRNQLAHEALLLGRVDCLRYVSAIECELKAWAVV